MSVAVANELGRMGPDSGRPCKPDPSSRQLFQDGAVRKWQEKVTEADS